jgi:hypothetical protein
LALTAVGDSVNPKRDSNQFGICVVLKWLLLGIYCLNKVIDDYLTN